MKPELRSESPLPQIRDGPPTAPICRYFEDHGIKGYSWASGVVRVLQEKNAACRTRTIQVLADLEGLEAHSVVQRLEEDILTFLSQHPKGVLRVRRSRAVSFTQEYD